MPWSSRIQNADMATRKRIAKLTSSASATLAKNTTQISGPAG